MTTRDSAIAPEVVERMVALVRSMTGKTGHLSPSLKSSDYMEAELIEELLPPPIDPFQAAIGEAFMRLPPTYNEAIFSETLCKVLRDRGYGLINMGIVEAQPARSYS